MELDLSNQINSRAARELIDRARAAARRNRAAARDDGETMKLMMVLVPAGLLLMPLGAARGHRTQPDGAQASRTADANSVLNRLSARALRLCTSKRHQAVHSVLLVAVATASASSFSHLICRCCIASSQSGWYGS